MAPFLAVRNLVKSFHRAGEAQKVIGDLSLDAADGEFLVFFGPNGCGKSTLLYALAGLEPFDSGEATIAGKPAADSRFGFVFQNFHEALFPYLSILQNVEFGPLAQGRPASEASKTAENWLAKVGLAEHAKKYPYELSGGMKQLAALARAWAVEPDVLAMDEPFSALDYRTRLEMEEELLQLWSSHKKTVLFVSHDVDEAVFLADRVVVLTERPCRVKKIIEINLPRPRTRAMRLSKEFFELRNQVIKAFEAQKK